uniref:DUF3504 domain-containing protein n=1 Tax=Strigamia maritima TaxID=126957 RepID=T1IRV1_STRMM
MAKSSRWGNDTIENIQGLITEHVPRNTKRNKEMVWNQFTLFCESKGYNLTKDVSIEQLNDILTNWACNMKKRNGEEYKESVVKMMWNLTAKLMQEKYFNEYKIVFNPFTDIEFSKARNARDTKRLILRRDPEKRKSRVTSFTAEERQKIIHIWDENTPNGLQKKFFNIAATELAWRCGEGASVTVNVFDPEKDNEGNFTGRIKYNPGLKIGQSGAESMTADKWLTPNLSDVTICPVRLYNRLLEMRPQHVTTTKLFLIPNPHWQSNNSKGWYKNIPVGASEISKWTKETAEKVGLDTKKGKLQTIATGWQQLRFKIL